NPTLANGVGDAIDGQHISCDAIVDAMSLREADHILERALHDVLELFVDHGFLPEISLAVLYPLEIRSGHAASIAENVRNHEDALVRQNIVSGRGGGTVGAFSQNPAPHSVGIAAGDLILSGRGNENFAVRYQQFGRVLG